eukprot:COSAG02_NODE_45260_length_359_cov_36.988417_1_plen_23_part_01
MLCLERRCHAARASFPPALLAYA